MEILSWFLLEALAAMALLGLVVWWTWPRSPNSPKADTHSGSDQKNGHGDQRE